MLLFVFLIRIIVELDSKIVQSLLNIKGLIGLNN